DATGQPVEYKNQVKGEAYFLRALANFETFKRYGGFPIVEGRVLPSSSGTLARNTIKECVDFIVKDCNTALEILNLVPGFPTVEHTGRASKSAIKALKAKTLLFAASPLFNTGTPYLSMENPANNTLICYGNFDKERWKLAADAAKDAIATANTEGFMLLDDPAKRSPNVSDLTKPILGNYRESWEKPDNKELIMSYKGFPTTGWWEYPWLSMTPMGSYPGSWMAPPCPSQNFIKLYEKKADGMPQVWPTSGSDLNVKYRELDNRFHQTIGYNMMPYWPGTINELQNYKAGNGFGAGQHSPQCKTGYWVKKCVPNEVGAGQMIVPVISVFRYNELLLNLAEALNEYESAPTTEAYDAVNKIRIRSGMPVLAAGLTKDQFRKRVQNERSIEFAFEGHRFWDIRRWLIAETVQTGPLLGLTITRINSANTDFQYVEKTVEIRNWPKRQYLHPIQRDELTRNTGFVQNPGYLK
ncbi:MAG: RagB/SusD family nutrient uptake outer membrane protein, partial [Pyrinomonadaceae bacterium]|nr:RagB/SusD family nutrient uptake outer membrane protein [Sphingobacteriaceae bacterium]